MPSLTCLDSCKNLLTAALLLLLFSLVYFHKRSQSDCVNICQLISLQWVPRYSESKSRSMKWFKRLHFLHLWAHPHHFLSGSVSSYSDNPIRHVIDLLWLGTCFALINTDLPYSLSFILSSSQWGLFSPLLQLAALPPCQHSWHSFFALLFFVSLNFPLSFIFLFT